MSTLIEEIVQQPVALAGVRKYYASPGAIPTNALRSLAPKWPPLVVFTGMGSSLCAALPAQAYLTSQGIRALTWETAELVHHHLKFIGPDTLVIVISQSGETAEAVRLIKELPRKLKVLAVVNVEASTLARRAGLALPMMAGRQSGVTTKTYMCSVAVLMYLAFAIARQDARMVTHCLREVIEAQENILQRQDELIPPTLEYFNHPTFTVFMSRGADLATAYQGALTLTELARTPVEAVSAAQFRHGPIEIVNTGHRYILIARKDLLQPRGRVETTAKLTEGLAETICDHGGRVMLFTDLQVKEAVNMRIIRVETMRLGLGTLVDSLHIQLMAHELAVRSQREPGKFWIAEEVTRQE